MATRTAWAVALLVVVTGCSGSATVVEVTLSHAPGLAMDRVELALTLDAEALATESLERGSVDGETVAVWLPASARGTFSATAIASLGGLQTGGGNVQVDLDGSSPVALTLLITAGGPGTDGGADGGSGTDAGPPMTDGGTGTDAGPGTDATSGTDATPPGTDAAPPLDNTSCDDIHAGAIFCDGFEDPTSSAWGALDDDPPNSNASRTTSGTYRGAGALLCEALDVDTWAVAWWQGGNVSTGDLYVRAYYYLPDTWSFAETWYLYMADDNNCHIDFALFSADLEMHVGPDGSSQFEPIGSFLPRDTWVCIETHVNVSGTNGVAEYWIDGSLVDSVSGVDTECPLPYSVFSFGMDWIVAPGTLLVDEVVIDDAPIGCD